MRTALTLQSAAVPNKMLSTTVARAGGGGCSGPEPAVSAASLAAPGADQSMGDFGEVAPEDDPVQVLPPPALAPAPPFAFPQVPSQVIDDDDDLT